MLIQCSRLSSLSSSPVSPFEESQADRWSPPDPLPPHWLYRVPANIFDLNKCRRTFDLICAQQLSILKKRVFRTTLRSTLGFLIALKVSLNPPLNLGLRRSTWTTAAYSTRSTSWGRISSIRHVARCQTPGKSWRSTRELPWSPSTGLASRPKSRFFVTLLHTLNFLECS